MKKTLKFSGIALAAVLGLLIIVLLVAYALGSASLAKTYDVKADSVSVPGDSASIESGGHWVTVLCVECHGEDLAGLVVVDDPILGVVNGPNLTMGEGGAAEEMSNAELDLAIRHGIDHDGRGLLIMPSAAYYHLSDADAASIIAYIRSVPPADREWDEPQVTFMGRVLFGLGLLKNVTAAEVINHDGPRPPVPAAGSTSEYGEYLARVGGCWECHGEQLSGGRPANPASPVAGNLTPGGHLGEWSQADFVTAMRDGVEPDGEELEAEFMPWEGIGKLTDHELHALWLYLQSLPALPDAVED